MEEHHYGGPTAGGGGDFSAASGAAAPPNGWASLTRRLRNPSPPPRDPFPPLVPATSSSNSSAAAENQQRGQQSEHFATNSAGERQRQQQPQRVVSCQSPASSAGSFSSNSYGRTDSRQRDCDRHNDSQADAPAAVSSNAAVANGFLVAAGGAPLESSSGSFAPNSLVGSNNQHSQRDRHRGGHRLSRRGSAGPASSAGSFSLNANAFRVQSGANDVTLREGRFPRLGAQDDGREIEVTGGARILADEDRREEISAADRDLLDVRPVASDGRSSIGDVDRDVNNGVHEQHGKDVCDSTAASSAFHVPMEPEWEEEDMYLRVRSDALKEARARDKFARGATQAYVRGDHRMAKILSKQAEEKRIRAEKLHAKAAAEILNQRNDQGSFDIWHLDLHGLHTSEAVAALESRLALLEHGLAEGQRLGVGFSASPSVRGGKDEDVLLERSHQRDPKLKLMQSLIPASKLLSVVTGVGAHSQGGPTLPSAVKSFLISNGYYSEEPRVGVISVRPKLRFSR